MLLAILATSGRPLLRVRATVGVQDIGVLSGPSFGKQNWCCGMNQTSGYGA